MYFSINRFTGDGTTTQWEFNFAGGYIDPAHVKVLVIDPLGVETIPTYTWVGPNTISIVPAVSSGSTLEVYRDTPKNLPLVDYTDGAIVSEKNLDTTAEQSVFVAAEVFDRFSDTEDLVVGAATAAVEAAELAAVAAGTAASDASAAQVAASNAAVSAAASQESLENIEADLDALVGGDFSDFLRGANNLSDVANASAGRINLGLGNVDNTSDVDKPVSTAQASAIEVAAQDVIDTFAAVSGSNIVGFQQAGTGAVATTVQAALRRFVNAEDFGVVPGLGVSQAVRQSNMVNFQKALDHVESIGGGDVLALDQYYLLEGAGLELGESVGIVGSGTAQWEPVFLAPQRYKGWSGTNLIFVGTGTKRWSLRGITSLEKGGGWRTPDGGTTMFKLTSFMNANAVGATAATPKQFSAAITNKNAASHQRLHGLRVVPGWPDGTIAGYDDNALEQLASDWDFGIWLRDSEHWNVENFQAVGYWRVAGRCVTAGAWYEGWESRSERNIFRDCKFHGRTGTIIRGPDRHKIISATSNTVTIPWTSEHYFPTDGNWRGSGNEYYTYTGLTYDAGASTLTFTGLNRNPLTDGIFHVRHRSIGFANSEDYNVQNFDLYHQSRKTQPELGLPIGTGLELSGQPLRGYKFHNIKCHVLYGPANFHFHDVQDAVFIHPQFEGGLYALASDSDERMAVEQPLKAGDTRNLRMYGDTGLEGSEINLALFNYRSGHIDGISYNPRPYLEHHQLITPALPDAELILRARNGQAIRLQNRDGTNNVLVVSDGGRVTLPQGLLYLEASRRIDANGNLVISTNGTTRLTIFSGSGSVVPGADVSQNLGSASLRWNTIYAATGTINTSDARAKQQVAALSAAETAVAVRLKGLIRTFKFNDAVQSKGDNARIHVGVIAQEVQAAFEEEGLNPFTYSILCYDEWGEAQEERDAEGNVTQEYRPAGNRYGVRYDELLAFIIAAL